MLCTTQNTRKVIIVSWVVSAILSSPLIFITVGGPIFIHSVVQFDYILSFSRSFNRTMSSSSSPPDLLIIILISSPSPYSSPYHSHRIIHHHRWDTITNITTKEISPPSHSLSPSASTQKPLPPSQNHHNHIHSTIIVNNRCRHSSPFIRTRLNCSCAHLRRIDIVLCVV